MSPSWSNDALWKEALELLPGGVNSPVRAFRAVGGTPKFFERGEGPYLFDVEGRRFIDLVGGWGPLLLGHAHPAVVAAATAAVARGSTFGTPSPPELDLARRVVAMVPSIEQVRFVNSGTEAVMSAIRLARAATGRAGDAALLSAGIAAQRVLAAKARALRTALVGVVHRHLGLEHVFQGQPKARRHFPKKERACDAIEGRHSRHPC
jgi:4-aminobutyrate aminotransferase-like enzyme